MSDNEDSCASLACTLGCLANSSGCPRTGCGWTPEPPAAPSAPPPRPLFPRSLADNCSGPQLLHRCGVHSNWGQLLPRLLPRLSRVGAELPGLREPPPHPSRGSLVPCGSRRRARPELCFRRARAMGQVLFNPGQNGVCLNVPSVSATAAWSQACAAPLLLPPHCKLASSQPHQLSVSTTVPTYAHACANASAERRPPLSSSSTATVLRSMGRCWAALPAWPPRWPSATASLSAARTGLPGSPAACL